jgi:hypothetical protein
VIFTLNTQGFNATRAVDGQDLREFPGGARPDLVLLFLGLGAVPAEVREILGHPFWRRPAVLLVAPEDLELGEALGIQRVRPSAGGLEMYERIKIASARKRGPRNGSAPVRQRATLEAAVA